MARVWGKRGDRRVLLGVGTLGGVEFRVPETAVKGPSPIQVPTRASPDAAYLARIRAGLIGGQLGREAGLVTWVRLPVLYRLLRGLDEERPTVERLIDCYGVELGGLLEQLATGALRCQVAGHPKTINEAHCTILCRAANVLEALRETLAVVWDSRVRLEVERGSDPVQAVELLNLDALHGAVGVEFDPFVFGPATDPLQEKVLVLLRSAAAVRVALPQSPDDLRERAPLVEYLDRAARILCDCRPSVEGSGGTATGFLDEIRATEQLLRTVRPRPRRPGHPRFTVERAVASDLVRFLVNETGQELLGHAAVLVSVVCPGLGHWRENTLRTVVRTLLDDVRLDDVTREAVRRCRPDALPPAGTWSIDLEPARTQYIDRLGTRLYHLLSKPA